MTTRFPGMGLLPCLFSGVLVCLLSSCGSSADPVAGATCDTSQATVATASFDALWTTVFAPQCGACHGAGTNSGTLGGPDLRTADAFFSGIVGKKGTDYADWDTLQKNREGCLDYELIKAGSASQSVVVAVLDSSVSLAGCTIKSHRDAPQSVCITASNLTKLKEWIDAGATR